MASGFIRTLSSLKEMLNNVPTLKRYYERPITDRIPCLFEMYARAKEASLNFDSHDAIIGYSESLSEKDAALKALHIMSVEYFNDDKYTKDLKELWAQLGGVEYGFNCIYFPRIFGEYLTSGPAYKSFAQADRGITQEVSHYLDKASSRKIYELSGHIGIIGDEYQDKESHTVFIPDWRERYFDNLVRTLNDNPSVTYTEYDLLSRELLNQNNYDTIVVNLANDGGVYSSLDLYSRTTSFFERVSNFRAKYPTWECHRVILVTEIEVCDSFRFKSLRERLDFYGFLDGVSIVKNGKKSRAVMSFDLLNFHGDISFRIVQPVGSSNDLNVNSFSIPLKLIHLKDDIWIPESLNQKETNTDLRKYLIALAGSPLINKEEQILEENHIHITSRADHIDGRYGLAQLLKEDSLRPVRAIDAVIINPNIDFNPDTPFKYEGLVMAESLVSYNVPFFIYSDIQKENLGDYATYILPNLHEHATFIRRDDDKALPVLIDKIRSSLDCNPEKDAAIRQKYAEELAAADHFDGSGEMTRIIKMVMNDDLNSNYGVKDSQDLINGLRRCADTLFNRAKEDFRMLPPLKLGEMQQFLMDGEFYDNRTKKIYVLDDSAHMHVALAASFGYFIKMTNGGSHGASAENIDVIGYVSQTHRNSIYKSCAYILMDLICWLKDICSKRTSNKFWEINLFEESDVVANIIPSDSDKEYYFIGKVHLYAKKGLVQGLPSNCIRIRNVSLDKFKSSDPSVPKLRYYAGRDDYDIVTSTHAK